MGELKKILREKECTGVIRPPGFLKSGFAFNPAVDYSAGNGDNYYRDQEKLRKKKDYEEDDGGFYQGQSQLLLQR